MLNVIVSFTVNFINRRLNLKFKYLLRLVNISESRNSESRFCLFVLPKVDFIKLSEYLGLTKEQEVVARRLIYLQVELKS